MKSFLIFVRFVTITTYQRSSIYEDIPSVRSNYRICSEPRTVTDTHKYFPTRVPIGSHWIGITSQANQGRNTEPTIQIQKPVSSGRVASHLSRSVCSPEPMCVRPNRFPVEPDRCQHQRRDVTHLEISWIHLCSTPRAVAVNQARTIMRRLST